MDRRRSASRPARDDGTTLVELVIAIVLVGTVVLGTLAALRATVISGTVHRDHTNAQIWLQSASDLLHATPTTPCDPAAPDHGEAALRGAYDAVVDSAPNPEGWGPGRIRVVPPVTFWNAADTDGDGDVDYFFSTSCDPARSLQLVRIEVTSADGGLVEDVEIVK